MCMIGWCDEKDWNLNPNFESKHSRPCSAVMTGHPVIDRRTCLYTVAWPDPVIREKKIRGPHRPWKYLHANARTRRGWSIGHGDGMRNLRLPPPPPPGGRTYGANRGHLRRRRRRHPCWWEEEGKEGKDQCGGKSKGPTLADADTMLPLFLFVFCFGG